MVPEALIRHFDLNIRSDGRSREPSRSQTPSVLGRNHKSGEICRQRFSVELSRGHPQF
jgi:hypothetical protein